MTVGVVLGWVAAVVAAFLVGSVNPATLIARVRGTDLSVAGSGNPGATNAGRVLTPSAAPEGRGRRRPWT